MIEVYKNKLMRNNKFWNQIWKGPKLANKCLGKSHWWKQDWKKQIYLIKEIN